MTAGVSPIDLHWLDRPGAISSWVIPTQEGPVLIDPGPASTLPALQQGVANLGWAMEELAGVLLTHIHLDHAAAAGDLAALNIPVYVHPVGQRHLIDPSRLMASAQKIYGDRLPHLFGTMQPVPPDRLHVLDLSGTFTIGDISFKAHETLGHAKHHVVFEFQHDGTRYLATGDAAGGFVAEAPTFAPAQLPPPDLDLMAWCNSIDLMEHLEADQLLVAHFGACADPEAHLHRLRDSLQRQYHYIREASDPFKDYRRMLEAEANAAEMHDPECMHLRQAAVEMNISGVQHAERRGRK
jgi:glyoxylase-like metal-dependent hydrolase (beta-lactamase superfamily II)